MTYYDELNKSYRRIAAILNEVKRQKIPVNIDKIMLETTQNFAVSPKSVYKRVEIMVKNDENLEIIGNEVISNV